MTMWNEEKRVTEQTDTWTTTAVAASAVAKDTPAAAAVAFRADVLRMTQAAEDAVLRPAEPGGWPHALRAALACRIARLNDCHALATRYLAMIDNPEYEPLAEPGSTSDGQRFGWCAAVPGFHGPRRNLSA